jgi:hypothetical protein
VIQMLCIARKTTALRISEGSSAGVIHVENGELVHAIWDDTVGEEAFFRMLAVKNGVFHTAPLPPDIERTLSGDWQYLLIEGLRHLDESAAGIGPSGNDRPSLRMIAGGAEPGEQAESISFLSQPRATSPTPREPASVTFARPSMGSLLGEPNSGATPPPTPRTPEVTRLVDEGFSALRAGRREDAQRAWETALALDPTNRMLELNLRKLVSRDAMGGAPRAPRGQ